MTSKHSFAFPRRVSPGVCKLRLLPSKMRAQGRPGARCTRGLACKIVQRDAHEHTGSAEAVRPSLRSGFTAYNVLSQVTGLFCHLRLRELPFANLTPASGRQDHTTSPSASARFVKSRFHVHRIPCRVDDVGQRPSFGRDTRLNASD